MEQEDIIGEFLILPGQPNPATAHLQPRQDFVANWTTNKTKVLLDMYKKYRPRVGSFEIKNLKKLWEVIATEINKILNTNYSSGHVENRWRVVERAYKKFVDNQTKTGRGRKFFEFQEEMDDIFKGKKNVKPEVLLSTETVEHLVEEAEEPLPSTSTATPITKKSISSIRKNISGSKNLTIEQMRKDRKEYNRERLSIENEKLEIQKKKINLMKDRNDLLRERNQLLQNKTCSCTKDFK